MAPDPRIKKACEAMKDYGFSVTKVRSALKELLKTYANNWELIEEENYKELVNYILEEAESKANEKKEKEAKKQSNSKGVATNSRGKRKAPEKQTQALVIYKEDDESEEEDEVPLKKVRRKPGRLVDYNGTNSLRSSMSKKVKEEEEEPKREEDEDDIPVLPPLKRYLLRSGEKIPAITLYNNTSCSLNNPMSMEPEMNSNAGALIVLDDDPLINHKPLISENSSALVLGIEKPNILVKEQDEEIEKTLSDTTTSMVVPSSAVVETSEHKAELELASSASGEAKISLCFTSATGEDTTNLCLPSMEEFLRAMEEKCLQTYKITHPGFSVLGFTKDMCSCYIDLAKNPTKQTLETETVSDTSKADDDKTGSMGFGGCA